MPSKQKDQFANQAVITCTETALNTLTFKKLETGISLFEKLAWIIHRIEYLVTSAVPGYFNATTDNLTMALTTTDQMTSIALTNAAVLDMTYLVRVDLGAAASGSIYPLQIYKDFSQLPGGGLIVPPNPLYGAIVGGGLTTAATAYLRLYYTNRELSPEEYWELVEARRIISA